MLQKKEKLEEFLLIIPEIRESTNTLLDEAKQRLQDVKKQQKLIREFRSNRDFIIRRHAADRSFFDKVAHWYGSTHFLTKVLINTLLIAASVLVGFYVMIVIPVLLVTFFAAIHFMLSDHYAVETSRRDRLSEDIENMETEISEQVAQLSLTEDHFQEVLVNLNEELIQFIENNNNLKKSVVSLDQQIADLTLGLQELEGVKTAVSIQNQTLTAEVQRLSNLLIAERASLQEKIREIHALNQNLSNTQCDLNSNHQKLTAIETLYRERVDNLRELDTMLREQLSAWTIDANNEVDPHITSPITPAPEQPIANDPKPLIVQDPEFSRFSDFLKEINQDRQSFSDNCDHARVVLERVLKTLPPEEMDNQDAQSVETERFRPRI